MFANAAAFPRAPPGNIAEVPPPPQAMNSQDGKLQLLVADDDANLRDALGEFFVREGFAVQLAASGLEAIELLRRRSFHVSILDGHMPGLSGPQVLRRLLEDAGPVAVPPTVLVSSDVAIETWVHGWRATVCTVEFVPKPIRLDALRRSIQMLLTRTGPPLT
jgi:DNA-binding response OmpR family regulator